MSASERVRGGKSCQAKSGLRLPASRTCAASSITQNANSPGIGAKSANAVVENFMRGLPRSFFPMRRNRLLEIRQRLDASLPRLEFRRQHAVRVEIRQLVLGAVHEREERIERKIRGRQRAGEKIAAHGIGERSVLLDDTLARFGDLAWIALFRLFRKRLTGARIERLLEIV